MINKKRSTNIIKRKLIRKPSSKGGFTLIEILVVIGIIAVLASVVLIAINPARQFKLARDSQRLSNITAILNAVGQIMAENKGKFVCSNPQIDLPLSPKVISNAGGADDIAIGGCLMPDYISTLPFDPIDADAHYTPGTGDYDTGYLISMDSASGRITVMAPSAEVNGPISVTR